ncbi:TPA: hypothetical protein N0F65_000924 [Lagenidium giganteum]|uniref:Uncharacterized protein n=1 Tax=Lagenidium giganteum TaxID=4803 RepID=A0AAV2YK82_9STRA|nr:TPA: hypothetical protein N0F65_000924 [Lagenidium giganteum]
MELLQPHSFAVA